MSKFIEFLQQYGAALLVLVIAYFRDQALLARNQKRISELEKKIADNHAKVDRDNADISDVDGVAKIAGPRD
ncbi:MAG TPA: hypothetical protein PKW79_00240 [Rhabdochlamydiaceae bacterium]|nr:hypothetical protein [Rhabdochlamydiaceae bacterium]